MNFPKTYKIKEMCLHPKQWGYEKFITFTLKLRNVVENEA